MTNEFLLEMIVTYAASSTEEALQERITEGITLHKRIKSSISSTTAEKEDSRLINVEFPCLLYLIKTTGLNPSIIINDYRKFESFSKLMSKPNKN
jgi:hypothetical protein